MGGITGAGRAVRGATDGRSRRLSGALALALAGIVALGLGAPAPARAKAGPGEHFDVDLAGPVREGRPARLLVTTACDNGITGTFEAGRRASGDGRTDVHDARGAPASSGEDYGPVSGTFSASKSEPFVIDIPIVDDDDAEGPEHVFVLFSLRDVLMTFAGDAAVCETPGPNTAHLEAAFTIEDDDPAPSPGSAPGSAPSGQGSAAAGPSAREEGGGGSGRGDPGSAAGPTTARSDPAPARDQLAEGEGIALVGSAARTHRPAADNDGAIWRTGATAIGAVGAAAGAGALLGRRRRDRGDRQRSTT